MPNGNNVPLSAAEMHFDDAPAGADMLLDELFSDDQHPQFTEHQPQAVPAHPVIKTTTGTVYNSLEDATRGVEEKDKLISELRAKLSAREGVDPITNKPVGSQTTSPEVPVSYLQDRKKYFQDLRTAVERNDEEAYFNAQLKLLNDAMSPYAGILQTTAKTQAVESVSTELPDFREIMRTPEFEQTLDSMPILKNAIQFAENDPSGAAQLRELYKVAYFTTQGRRMPELVRNTPPPTPTQPRPAMVASSVPPPATPNSGIRPDLSTSEGRKAIIEQQKALGVDRLRF